MHSFSDIFLPCPDDLLVNLQESKSLVTDLLTRLPTLFENNVETRSALGAALQAAFKMTVRYFIETLCTKDLIKVFCLGTYKSMFTLQIVLCFV